jgi:hypothetical protein
MILLRDPIMARFTNRIGATDGYFL